MYLIHLNTYENIYEHKTIYQAEQNIPCNIMITIQRKIQTMKANKAKILHVTAGQKSPTTI